MISTYSEFQAQPSSEKIGLVIVEASRRLMGWTLHSGSVYRLENFDHPVIVALEEAGVSITEAGSLAEVTAGKYFHDRAARKLYLQTTDSTHPNGKFLALTFRMFFCGPGGGGIRRPHDLGSGFEVEWLPLYKGSSEFGVGLDSDNQLGMAIEGSGSVQFVNDQSFWGPKYDKLYFENQRVFIYSYSRALPISEAKLTYRGRIQSKGWDAATVSFQLKDFLNELRAPVPLDDMSSVAGIRIPANLLPVKQRRLYGYVQGHRPLSVDQVLDGYPITGTVSATTASKTITGVGTQFLKELSPGDDIYFGDEETRYTIDTVTNDLSAELTEVFERSDQIGVEAIIQPKHPKRWMNRRFIVAGHPLCEPVRTVTQLISTTTFRLSSVEDLLPSDDVVVNGEQTRIQRIAGDIVKLTTTLEVFPDIGSIVTRPAITNVYLNARKLLLDRDYTYDPNTAEILLDELAEFNVAPVKRLNGTVAFTSGSRTATGTGTFFTNELKLGDWVRASGQSQWVEVLRIISDTQIEFRTAAPYTASGICQHKQPEVYEEGSVIMTCDVLGATDTGATSGSLLKKGPQIVRDLLARIGLEDEIAEASFTEANDLAEHRLALVIPTQYTDTKAPSVRDTINRINKSIFGALIQNRDFQLEYSVLEPARLESATQLREFDVLNFSVQSSSDRIAKKVRVQYQFKEYDRTAKGAFNLETQAMSETAQYLAKTEKEEIVPTVLVDTRAAEIYASRWAFIREICTSKITIQTKLQGARLQVNDRVELFHEKLYERQGGSARRRVAAVSEAKKSVSGAKIELEDLAGSFRRCSIITPNDSPDYVDSGEQDRLYHGYITDSFGLMDNDAETYGNHVIW